MVRPDSLLRDHSLVLLSNTKAHAPGYSPLLTWAMLAWEARRIMMSSFSSFT